MKVILKEAPKPSSDRPFPKLMVTDIGTVVLARGKGPAGIIVTVLATGSGTRVGVGEHFNDWFEESLSDFIGELTIMETL